MRTKRFLVDLPIVDDLALTGQVISLSARDSHHLRHVLRLAPGAAVEVVGRNRGVICGASVHSFDGELVRVTLCDVVPIEDSLQLHLLCGMTRLSTAEFIVEKATETGVSSIMFFAAHRSQGGALRKSFEGKITRLERMAEDAIKQSGARTLPSLELFDSLQSALEEVEGRLRPGAERLLFATGREGSPIPAQVPENPLISPNIGCPEPAESHPKIDLLETQHVCADSSLVIGPEGGLTKEECDLALGYSYRAVSLGKRTLRTETAVIAACVLVSLRSEERNRK